MTKTIKKSIYLHNTASAGETLYIVKPDGTSRRHFSTGINQWVSDRPFSGNVEVELERGEVAVVIRYCFNRWDHEDLSCEVYGDTALTDDQLLVAVNADRDLVVNRVKED